jgi:hypothetical protein
MFDTVRFWAYKAIRAHRGSTFDVWLGKVLEQCQNANSAFIEPLPHSEVKATAKSIARYCWKKDGYHYQEFIDRQSRKGAMGGKKSKRLPINGSEASTKPWEELGISRRSYYYQKSKNNCTG